MKRLSSISCQWYASPQWWCRCATLVLPVISVSCSLYAAPPPSNILADPQLANYASVAYNVAFIYNSCGNADFGAPSRRALREFINSCPFSANEKYKFNQSAANSDDQFREYLANRNHVASGIGFNGESCKDFLSKNVSQMAYRRDRLARFERGEISASAALGVSCDGHPIDHQ